jgi:tubulin polyglutamylase TTLL1
MASRSRRVRWRTDFEKGVLCDNFDALGWHPCTGGDDWNFYWATIHSIRALFHPDAGTRLHDAQIVNHFPNHYELTRKDLMAKNVKRFLKDHARSLVAAARPGAQWVGYMLLFVLPLTISC